VITVAELERFREILARPLVTEKSMTGAERGKYTFRVPLEVTKPEIRRAVEALFGVKVVKVNTMRVLGKPRRYSYRHREGRTARWKKAIVTLSEGQTIELFEAS